MKFQKVDCGHRWSHCFEYVIRGCPDDDFYELLHAQPKPARPRLLSLGKFNTVREAKGAAQSSAYWSDNIG